MESVNQHHLQDDEDPFLLEDDQELPAVSTAPKWKVLLVDDEPSIHSVTKLALENFKFDEQGLEFLSAYSAEEAKGILAVERDIAVILLDVVMETEHAGLELARHIR
jgi:CheY-like chemotaxis protein